MSTTDEAGDQIRAVMSHGEHVIGSDALRAGLDYTKRRYGGPRVEVDKNRKPGKTE